MNELIITNATIVMRDDIRRGSVLVRDGVIADIAPSTTQHQHAIDLDGDFLLPGLIEMHTDDAERHFSPRSGYLWPASISALLAHDAQLAGAGITTVYDAISVGTYSPTSLRPKILASLIDAIEQAAGADILRADHRIHLRCEVSDDNVIEQFSPYASHPLVQLVSLMDHTPGQRQWQNLDDLRRFQKTKMSDRDWAQFVEDSIARRSQNAAAYRAEIVRHAQSRGIPIATHDDTTVEHVDEAIRDGANISEFPTTRNAATAAKAKGMATVMGAPNVVRGGSHSGNVAATELAEAGLLDGLSSDYMPMSLIDAPFVLHEKHGLPIPGAIALVSSN
ncbi:MAG: alpha-D-ribose 1-methylphosphonate 5-triphosphate diphosphatase, partial [Pseudomonadota bacterium]